MAATTTATSGDAAGTARIFSIPPGFDFLTSFAGAVLAGRFSPGPGNAPGPLDLARATILLPTRRACRALQDAFLDASGGRASLLPRIRPLTEGDEERGLLAGLDGRDPSPAGPEPAGECVGEMERLLVLTRLVLKWSEAAGSQLLDGDLATAPLAAPTTPAQACHLAMELARIMDMVEAEEADFAALEGVVPEVFSDHWRQTLEFLKIATSAWPAYLDERGLTSPGIARNLALRTEAQMLEALRPPTPYIIAGVADAHPAAVDLMRTVLALPAGAVVLPGLDRTLDEATWCALSPDHPEHPQFGLCRLLGDLGIARDQVADFADAELGDDLAERAALVGEALRPGPATDHWPDFIAAASPERIRSALAGVSLLEAESVHQEAEIIAMIMRGAAEVPGRTAALVTPDRALARRVAIRLEEWGLRIDDSAGRPLAKTPPGSFLDLVVGALGERFHPPALMALLKHPLTRLGLAPGIVRRAARALELIAFRRPYLGDGLAGIRAALDGEAGPGGGDFEPAAVARLGDEARAAARDLVGRLEVATTPLATLLASSEAVPLSDLVRAHLQVAEALAGDENGDSGALWRAEAGQAAALFLTGLLDQNLPAPAIRASDYGEFFRTLIAGEVVRPVAPTHPRLFIWGPLEARLQRPDTVILGGLEEGTWPAIAQPDPWLNRAMRESLGLPAPEQRIGLAAHDFSQLLGAGEVYLTRALKVNGAPNVPSRWLMRLTALLAGLGLDDALEAPPETPWLAWVRVRNEPGAHTPIRAPEPRPPVAARPRRLSVTRIEAWLANPYAIFARFILGLEALDPIGSEPDAAARGAMIHRALHRFTQSHGERLPDDVAGELVRFADDVLAGHAAQPRIAAFWRPRFARFAAWFAETEPGRRQGIARSLAEITGRHRIAAPAGPFEITARADRIDVGGDGSLTIYDYKSGAIPPDRRVLEGNAKQLPLEAAIALAGGYTGLAAASVEGLVYISAAGGEPPGMEHAVACGDDGVPGVARAALKGLGQLVAAYDDAATPYRALRRPGYETAYRYDAYDHLARVAEWIEAEADD